LIYPFIIYYWYITILISAFVSQLRHGRLQPLLRLLRQRSFQAPPQRAAALLVALAVEDVENGVFLGKMVKGVEKIAKIGEKHEEFDGKQVWKIMTFWKNV